MAAFDVTKKLHIYHTLYRLNRSFASIVGQCRSLQESGVFRPASVRMFQGLTQELQSEINQQLLGAMQETELDDWNTFGKVRKARERELRDANGEIHSEKHTRRGSKQRKKAGN
jgi:hypothetical protein